MRAAMLAALLLATAVPADARPNAQLVASVQHRLDALGFQGVDAGALSTAQIASLHLQLDGQSARDSRFPYFALRQRVRIILGLD